MSFAMERIIIVLLNLIHYTILYRTIMMSNICLISPMINTVLWLVFLRRRAMSGPGRGGRHTFGGLLLPLRWVAPATISQKWSWNRRKGRRHATLWSICCLFCFINFFWFICQNFEKNEFPNSWCKFKKWNGRIFFPKPLWKLFKMGPSR